MSNVCILCHTNDFARELYPSNVRESDLNVHVFSARRLPDRLHGRILRCGACGLVYASPLLDTSRLADLYAKSTYTYNEEEPYIQRTYGRYIARARHVLQHQAKPLSYLDVGCGNGFMLQEALAQGFEEVCGVEPSQHAIDQANPSVRSRILHGMFSRTLMGDRRFDLVTCFQTLDHLTEPVAFVRECLSILKPGGAVLFINHNIASLTARLLGEHCPMIDIEHTYLHTPATMRRLFSEQGFTDIQVFAVRNDYPIHYWMHLVPGPHALKTSVIRRLKSIALGRIVLPLYAGNLGLIARKPQE